MTENVAFTFGFCFSGMAVFPSSASITFPLLIHPQNQLGNLSLLFFTGATYKLRKAVIQVFSTPVSSYSSTDLQHTAPLNRLGSLLTPVVHHGNSIAKGMGTPFASLEEKPSQGPVPKMKNAPPCSPVPHPQSSRMHQSCLCLESQCEKIH